MRPSSAEANGLKVMRTSYSRIHSSIERERASERENISTKYRCNVCFKLLFSSRLNFSVKPFKATPRWIVGIAAFTKIMGYLKTLY